MKNICKILLVTLLVTLFGIVSVSALIAAQNPMTQDTETTIDFNVPTGIRWVPGSSVFEVFNAAGVSYIASDIYIGPNGEFSEGTPVQNAELYEIASGTSTYRIMQNIIYTETESMVLDFKVAKGDRNDLSIGGVIDGRGNYLKGFPMIGGTSLFKNNAGTIQNLKILDPTYISEGSEGSGFICQTNSGLIEDCMVYGNLTIYSSGLAVTFFKNIGGIAHIGNGTIMGSTNELNITTTGKYAGGIIALPTGGSISNCVNKGNIKTGLASSVGGIAGFAVSTIMFNNTNFGNINGTDAGGILGSRDIGITLSSNINHGDITGTETACGILGGDSVIAVIVTGNENSGTRTAPKTAPIYIHDEDALSDEPVVPTGIQPPVVSTYGIYYYAPNAFLIDSAIGFSYIGSDVNFSDMGEIVEIGTPNSDKATDFSYYYITNDIAYPTTTANINKQFTTMPVFIGGLVDGRNFNFTGFPLRSLNAAGAYTSALFALNNGTIRNIKLTVTSSLLSQITIAGLLCHTNNGTISNCTVSSTAAISTTRNLSIGVISYSGNGGTFKDCTSNVNVTTAGLVGGIVANPLSSATIIGCTNTGNLVTNNTLELAYAGGIVAYTLGTLKIANCINRAVVTAETAFVSVRPITYAGGIVGYAGSNTVISDCVNESSGIITGTSTGNDSTFGFSYVGGIAGYIAGSSTRNTVFDSKKGEDLRLNGGVIINSRNEGKINVTESGASATYYNSVGGIVGFLNVGSTYCYFTVQSCESGSSTSGDTLGRFALNYTNAGGIIGTTVGASATQLFVNNCYNMANIDLPLVGSFPGGVMGMAKGPVDFTVTITNCINAGKIQTRSDVEDSIAYAGGIIGFGNGIFLELEECENSGEVLSEGIVEYAQIGIGGVVGYSSARLVALYCDNSANISLQAGYMQNELMGTKFCSAGGIAGCSSLYTYMEGCRNLGSAVVEISDGFEKIPCSLGGIIGRVIINFTSMGTVSYSDGIPRIVRCYNFGEFGSKCSSASVSAPVCIGGVVGWVWFSSVSGQIWITDCTNDAEGILTVNGIGSEANVMLGGIVGYLSNSSMMMTGSLYIENCKNFTTYILRLGNLGPVGGLLGGGTESTTYGLPTVYLSGICENSGDLATGGKVGYAIGRIRSRCIRYDNGGTCGNSGVVTNLTNGSLSNRAIGEEIPV